MYNNECHVTLKRKRIQPKKEWIQQSPFLTVSATYQQHVLSYRFFAMFVKCSRQNYNALVAPNIGPFYHHLALALETERLQNSPVYGRVLDLLVVSLQKRNDQATEIQSCGCCDAFPSAAQV